MNGYPSDKPCEICAKHDNNQIEPRFLYVLCEKHQDLSPMAVCAMRNLIEDFHRARLELSTKCGMLGIPLTDLKEQTQPWRTD